MKDKLSITINKKTVSAIDSIIDNLYIRNRSQAIEYLIERSLGENKIAVIIAGGDENKLKISNTEYKPTAIIGNLTVIELAIKKLRESDFREVFIITRKAVLQNIFQVIGDGSKYGIKINYVEEEKSSGSADSLRLLRGKIKTSFLVVYSDIIFNRTKIKELWDAHLKQNAIATLLIISSPAVLKNSGIVKIEGNRIIDFIEKPKTVNSNIFFSGIFIAEPEIFEYQGNSLEKDIFPLLSEKGFLYSYINSSQYFHFHTKKELKKIEEKLKET